MGIKTLLLLVFPMTIWSQGRLFIEPQIFSEFGTKSPQKEINFSTVYEEYLPLSKVGDINFSGLNFGVNLGYQRNNLSYSIFYKRFNAVNGYGIRKTSPHSSFIIEIGSPLPMFGFELSKVFKSKNPSINHLLSFSSSFSLKRRDSNVSELDSTYRLNYLAIENHSGFSKIGVFLGLKYTAQIKYREKNLFDVSFYYQQGLRTINTINVKLIDQQNNYTTDFTSKTKGSEFGFVLSRKFFITKNKQP